LKRPEDARPELGFDTDARDRHYWAQLDELFAACGYDHRTILRNFPAYVMRRDLPRFLSHYELFKKVVDLPGSIVDLGVFRGASLFTWSSLMDVFFPFDRTRRCFGFDSFEGLQHIDVERDGRLDHGSQKVTGGYKASRAEIETLVHIHNLDNLMPGNERIEIVDGNVTETLPRFIAEHPGLSISLLHFDMDLYEPTKVALELLYPRVVKGGVICFDEYGTMPWEGEMRAVHEYLDSLGERPVIHKHAFTQQPSGYFVK